jgi:hypothetical protein
MPTMEELLAKQTYKEGGLGVEERVFYTLTDHAKLTPETLHAHRNSKAIALLFKTLLDAGTLKEDQLDEILLEVIS